MKIANSYREFNKILRKYSKRIWKYSRRDFWSPFVSYSITTKDQINQIKHTKLYKTSKNLRLIIKELEDNYNLICFFDTWEFGYLIGIEITNEDFYYLYKIDDKVKCQSCVGGINRGFDKVYKAFRQACIEIPEEVDKYIKEIQERCV